MRYLISTICIALLLWGCDNTIEVPAKPKVVRKKIVAPTHDTAKARKSKSAPIAKKSPAAQPQNKQAMAKVNRNKPVTQLQPPAQKTKNPQPVVIKKAVPNPAPMSKSKPLVPKQAKISSKTAAKNKPVAQKQAEVKSVADSKILTADKKRSTPPTNREPEPIAGKKPAISPKSEITKVTLAVKKQPRPGGQDSAAKDKLLKDKLIASKSATPQDMLSASLPPTYDPTGKIDPFEPLFKDQPTAIKKKRRKKRVPRTPLERIDLAQLKLVGIILAASGNRALVEEASGKGYVIKKGTYIGTNSGKVIKIQKEIVTVEEEFEDVFGKIKTRNRELKLPKPPGEF